MQGCTKLLNSKRLLGSDEGLSGLFRLAIGVCLFLGIIVGARKLEGVCSANNTICLYVPLFAYYEVPSLLLGQAKRCVDFKPKIFWLQQGLEH